MKKLLISILSLVLVSCNGSNSPSFDNTKTSTTNGSVKEAIFADTAVTSFTQTGGVANYKPSLMDKVFSSAYAISGNIRCVEGAPVAFELDALGNTVQINTTCNNYMDLSIRQGLLATMAGKRMLASRANGVDIRSQGRVLTLNAGGSFWSTYENIPSGNTNNGKNEHLCKDKFTFDEAMGTVTIEHDVLNSLLASTDTTQGCLDVEFPGATLDDYKAVLPFRFKNGKIELDGVGSTDFVDSNIVEFCIDDNSDSLCD